MSQLLPLSRAARLLGVSRGALQKKIQDGGLPSFDGMVATKDLLLAYPDTKFEEDLVLERLEQIKEEAFAKRVRERALPEKEVLAARLYEQSRELADVRTHLQQYHSIVVRAQDRLRAILEAGAPDMPPEFEALSGWLNQQLEEVLDTKAPDTLDVMDDYLRVVSAHVILQPSRHEFFVDGSDTILEAALRSGLALNYGCSSGNCGLCKARIVSGQSKKVRHHDYVLSEAEKNMGYALMCSHTAVTDLVVEALEASRPGDIPVQAIQARVKSLELLADKVMRLRLQTPRTNRLRFLAGQSVKLSIGEIEGEAYSVASCPCDDRNLEFHIRNLPDDAFAQRVFKGLKSGDTIAVEGPFGDFVMHDESHRSPLLIACNNGFAPIKSLIEHTMAIDTVEDIYLYRMATFIGGHYQSNICRSWADALDNFHYTEVTADALSDERISEMLEKIGHDHPDLSMLDIYLAGPEVFVSQVREWLQEQGIPKDQLLCAVV